MKYLSNYKDVSIDLIFEKFFKQLKIKQKLLHYHGMQKNVLIVSHIAKSNQCFWEKHFFVDGWLIMLVVLLWPSFNRIYKFAKIFSSNFLIVPFI